MPSHPLIAVTRSNKVKDRRYSAFRNALFLCGANTVHVHTDDIFDLDKFDGLLLSNGTDIHPSHYDEAPAPDYTYDTARDAMEIEAFNHFKKQGKPIMGICRGMQMVNVCLGGTLYQEIADHFDGTKYPRRYPQKYFFRKPVNIIPDTLLSTFFEKEQIQVNRLHHQAVKDLGEGLKINAIEPKGIIQGIEHETIKNIFGVQWHPELMHFSLNQWKLFKHFVSLCS